MLKTTGDFAKAWYHNCPKHRKIRYLFFNTCWKCDILEHAKSYREIKLMLIAKKLK